MLSGIDIPTLHITLDGWKEAYTPLLARFEGTLAPGAATGFGKAATQ
ncbi:MAG: hypothetical protein SF172_15915 [Burkholderiales bacterium]|nr:hypothetical protein [Burkholderiales bacterium]